MWHFKTWNTTVLLSWLNYVYIVVFFFKECLTPNIHSRCCKAFDHSCIIDLNSSRSCIFKSTWDGRFGSNLLHLKGVGIQINWTDPSYFTGFTMHQNSSQVSQLLTNKSTHFCTQSWMRGTDKTVWRDSAIGPMVVHWETAFPVASRAAAA